MKHDSALAEHPVISRIQDFDQNSGVLLERVLFNNRKIVVAICAVVTMLLGIQSMGIHIGASFEKMIPTGHPYISNFIKYRSDLSGLGNSLRIAVEAKSGTIFSAEYLETLRKINDDLFLYPGVDRPYMKSLWTPATRWTGVTEEGLDGGPVIPDNYDGSADAIMAVKSNVVRSGEVGQLVAADYRSSVILVPLLEGQSSTEQRLDYGDLAGRLDSLRYRYESPEIGIHITGFAMVVGDLIHGIRQVLTFFAVALMICWAALWVYTGCARSASLVLFCSLVAVVWLLGLLTTCGYELDPYSVLVPFLVFAIGMSHGAQKMNGIMQDIGRGTHKLVAARYTFRRLFVAGLTALLADAVGFAVLMIIDIRVIRELAITASMGVAVLIFTNLILLPILLSYTNVNKMAASRSLAEERDGEQAGSDARHPLWAFLDRFTTPRTAALSILVATILGGFGIWIGGDLKVGDLDPGAPELRQDSRYNLDSAFMRQHYGAGSDIYVAMVTTPQFGCARNDVLMKVDELEWALRQLDGVEATNSLAGLAKRTSVGMNEGSMAWYEIPRSQDLLNSIVTRAPRELLNQNCDLLAVYAYLKDHKSETLDRVTATIAEFAARNDTADVKFLQAAGNSGVDAATNIVVREANRLMTILVYVAVTVLAFITFRSWRAVVCAILPLMLTSALCEALMVYLGIGVKVATLPVIALGVGIGVDYSLYIMSVVLEHLRNGERLSVSYYRSLLFTGKVVILTGITLGIAVSTWAFSPIKFQADMGILLAFMFVLNMLGALVLVPALACILLRPSISSAPPGEISPA